MKQTFSILGYYFDKNLSDVYVKVHVPQSGYNNDLCFACAVLVDGRETDAITYSVNGRTYETCVMDVEDINLTETDPSCISPEILVLIGIELARYAVPLIE